MTDEKTDALVTRLRAFNTNHDRPPYHRFPPICEEAAARIEALESLVRAMLENDPDDMAADGVTVLDVWRKDARAALEGKG